RAPRDGGARLRAPRDPRVDGLRPRRRRYRQRYARPARRARRAALCAAYDRYGHRDLGGGASRARRGHAARRSRARACGRCSPGLSMKVLAALAVGARRRLPLVLQTEAAECGLACVAMIASYHGRRIDLAVLRRRHGVSMKGATLASLRDVAQRLGLATRAVRLELDEIGALRTPCILHLDLDHFVVLKRARRRAWIVLDPAAGERRLSPAEASRSFTGVALELWPEADFVRGEERERVRLRALMGRVTGFFRSLAQILLLAAAIEVFVAVSPLYLQWVIDHALPAANRDLLTTLALGFGLLVVFRHAVAALRSWVIMHIGAVLSVQWQANVLDHLLRLPMPY